MKFTLSWLKDYLDTTASLTEICDKLTALGLEVEGVEDPGKALAPFIIAHVLTAEQHPNADRLKVTSVDTGKEKLQVVCGAPNCRAGLKVVLARPGDVMPDTGEALKKGVIRGVESQGMLCAADELKLQDEKTSGIIELPVDAPVGGSYAQYAKLDDPVIEIKLTPNRPDCTGVYGIARDLAAAGLGTLKPMKVTPVPATGKSGIAVKLNFPAGDKSCPVFTARVIRNIKNGPSPLWMQQRLKAIGLRPISALVDITNYFTFDCARPLHVFDAKKVKGDLWLAPAKGGEALEALNGKTYVMEPGMAIIGDDAGVQSLAGIMGGTLTSVDETTTDVILESAYFDAVRTAKTGRALQVTSDARYRFERGVDPAFTTLGAELATRMILDLCGTPQTTVGDMVVAGAEPVATRTISLAADKCRRHTGVDVALVEQAKILTALGFTVKEAGGNLSVTTPPWRPDVEGDVDLVEEVIRVKGYENVTPLSLDKPQMRVSPLGVLDRRAHAARRALASLGLLEAVTWSFMPHDLAMALGGGGAELRLQNPISSDLDQMRPSIVGNLVQAAKRNADRGFADVGLFEVGPVFKNATAEGQAIVATILRAGSTPRAWNMPSRAVDVFDAKADAIAALQACGAPVASLQVTADAPAWYHPGRSGCLRLGPTVLAVFGEIHPAFLAAAGAEGPMVAAEVYLDALPTPRGTGTAKPLLKLDALQPVVRDFAFVVDRAVSAASLIKATRDAEKNITRDVSIFDVYEGDRVETGKKSVALSVTWQPTDKTLTDAEIDALMKRVTESVAKATGAVLRG